MSVFKCKMCGGSLDVSESSTVCECEYCGTQQTLPKTDNAQNLNMFNRANHFRQQCEFDKAAEIYERMLHQTDGDAELYWSLVLCRYGIEYVDDSVSKRKIPTCHRTQFQSILEDTDYLAAIEHADASQRVLYTSEAQYIDSVQKQILAISQKEEPFDIFICYKETDESGKRTQDSVLAQELYYGLEREGFKVFFSRITLESKLGTEYEPYIFAALNSAKVMVVVGTKPEYFNAVWMRNEWSRYLMLMQNDHLRTLIPAYKDMDPYNLPDALSMFQAQDMSKLGFMQDLIHGIRKITQAEPEKTVVRETVITTSANRNIENLLKRGNLALDDGKWAEASGFFEQVLNEDAEEPRAYLGKLMVELHVHRQSELRDCAQPFDQNDNFKRTIRFADELIVEKLTEYISHINERNERTRLANERIRLAALYSDAKQIMNSARDASGYAKAAMAFREISGFEDADAMAQLCEEKAEYARCELIYRIAKSLSEKSDIHSLQDAIRQFNQISDFKDVQEQIRLTKERLKEQKRKNAETEAAEKRRILAEQKWKRRTTRYMIIAAITIIVLMNLIMIAYSLLTMR